MKLKRGSVTPVDLTGQADGDYIRNDGGIYKPRTPSRLAEDAILADRWQQIYGHTLTTRTTAAGGSIHDAYVNMHMRLRANAQAGSTAFASTNSYNAWNMGVSYSVLNFDKRIVWKFRFTQSSHAASTVGIVKRMGLGGYHASGTGYESDPAYKMVGVKWINSGNSGELREQILQGIAHDGTNFHTTNIETANPAITLKELMIVSDGSGSVDYYINDVLVGNIATGPVGSTSAHHNAISVYCYNDSDTTDFHDLQLFNNRIYVHQ